MKTVHVAVTTDQHKSLHKIAKAQGITMSRLLLLAGLEMIGFEGHHAPPAACRACGKSLVKTVTITTFVKRVNQSGFCRECQRAKGLPQLRKNHA